ncbi:MAG: hypothetical protein DRO88_04520 [Promethearchaeia archaeon]|nr:MAG: hypothetical protein DRO88_04520 [Candidatus Lokiarchaeia archaeon]
MKWNTETFLLMMGFVIVVVILLVIIANLWQKNRKVLEYQAKYPSRYVCLDGDVVRSISECLVDNFLYRNGIKHKYEDVIVKSAAHQYKYDWYLPDINLYLEFFGFSGKKYKETMEKKKKFYRVNHLSMMEILPSDLADVNKNLREKFGKYWGKIAHTQERHCPHCGQVLDERV